MPSESRTSPNRFTEVQDTHVAHVALMFTAGVSRGVALATVLWAAVPKGTGLDIGSITPLLHA